MKIEDIKKEAEKRFPINERGIYEVPIRAVGILKQDASIELALWVFNQLQSEIDRLEKELAQYRAAPKLSTDDEIQKWTDGMSWMRKRTKEQMDELRKALGELVGMADKWDRVWFRKEEWAKLENAKSCYPKNPVGMMNR